MICLECQDRYTKDDFVKCDTCGFNSCFVCYAKHLSSECYDIQDPDLEAVERMYGRRSELYSKEI